LYTSTGKCCAGENKPKFGIISVDGMLQLHQFMSWNKHNSDTMITIYFLCMLRKLYTPINKLTSFSCHICLAKNSMFIPRK